MIGQTCWCLKGFSVHVLWNIPRREQADTFSKTKKCGGAFRSIRKSSHLLKFLGALTLFVCPESIVISLVSRLIDSFFTFSRTPLKQGGERVTLSALTPCVQ